MGAKLERLSAVVPRATAVLEVRATPRMEASVTPGAAESTLARAGPLVMTRAEERRVAEEEEVQRKAVALVLAAGVARAEPQVQLSAGRAIPRSSMRRTGGSIRGSLWEAIRGGLTRYPRMIP